MIRSLKIAGGLYILYLILGFFAVPRIIKNVLEGRIATTLDKAITLEKATFNPFLLSTTLTGLRVEDDAGDILLDLGHLYSNNACSPSRTCRSIYLG